MNAGTAEAVRQMGVFSKFFSQFSPDPNGAYLFFWVLALFFVMALAIFVERIFFVVIKSNINAEKFMNTIYGLVQKGDLKKATQLAESLKDKALGFIIYEALREASSKEFIDYRSIQNAVDEATLQIIPRLNKRTPWLSTFASVATLLGLMGTLFGLIISFEAVSAGGPNASKLLAQGVSTAMLTTLAGLFVAVPSMLAYALLNNFSNAMMEEIDEHSVKLIHMLVGGK